MLLYQVHEKILSKSSVFPQLTPSCTRSIAEIILGIYKMKITIFFLMWFNTLPNFQSMHVLIYECIHECMHVFIILHQL